MIECQWYSEKQYDVLLLTNWINNQDIIQLIVFRSEKAVLWQITTQIVGIKKK